VADRPLRQALAYYAWLAATAAILDFGVYRLPVHGWGVVGEQVGGYALMIAPLAIWAPRTFASLAMPRWQALAGVALILAAVGVEGLRLRIGAVGIGESGLRDLATGIGEELAFRGFLWDRAQAAGLSLRWIISLNVVTFTGWHLISVAAGLSQLSGLASVALLGLLFSLVRLWSGNTGLPALLHAAADIAGV
jgi:Type II CAAX prenyl endopeptidase Rce1-like